MDNSVKICYLVFIFLIYGGQEVRKFLKALLNLCFARFKPGNQNIHKTKSINKTVLSF